MNIRNLLQMFFGILTFIPGIYYLRANKLGSGGSFSSRYCYSVWMRHIYFLDQKKNNLYNKTIAEMGPGDSIGAGLMGLLLGAKNYYAFDTVEFANVERNLKIFDDLVFLIKSKTSIPDEDEFPRMQPSLEQYNFPNNFYSDKFLEEVLSDERINKIRYSIKNQNKADSMIAYITPNNKRKININKKIDFIFSQATLEHVDDLISLYRNFKNWLSPHGVMSHSIDFKSHGYAKSWDGHWSFSNFRWFLIRGKRPYLINRQPLSLHLNLHKRFNFMINKKKLINMQPTLNKTQYNSHIVLSDIDKKTSGVFIQSQHR
jgi:hypothetical protein